MVGGRWATDGLDRVGMGLLLATLAWISMSGVIAGGVPGPMVAVFIASGAAVIIGRAGAAISPSLVPAIVVGAALILALLSPTDTFSSEALEGPLGYPNAKAAFYVQAAAAAVMVAVTLSAARAKAALLAAAALFAFVVPIASHARAASAVAAALPVAAVLAWMGKPVRTAIAASGALLLLAVVATTLIAAGFGGRGPLARATAALDQRRIVLWSDAFSIMRDHPIIGVGPDRFQSTSPLAQADADARWAHHGFLQQGAETGVVGLALLTLTFVWGFARLWVSTAPPGVIVLGAYGLASLGILACFDYVMHFPMVTIPAAALVGSASGPFPSMPGSVSARRRGWRPEALARKAGKAAVLPMGLLNRRRPGDVVILLYHRIGVGPSEIDLPLVEFQEQMAVLAHRERLLSLEEALAGDRQGGVVVSFDDGSPDFHEHVLPILRKQDIPVVLYLATGLVAGETPGGANGALTWSQLAEAVSTGLVTIGSHTHSHADLSRSSQKVAEEEMGRSKGLVEERLGVPCRHFAYPWGVGSPEADRVARRLFDSAALGAWRTNRRGRIDPYRLGRTPILRSDGSVFFRAKIAGMLDSEAMIYRLLRRGPWRRSGRSGEPM